MSGLTEQFVVLLTFSCLFVLCEETMKVTVEAGEDATLQCQTETNKSITVIEWSRADLESDDYVFFRENRPYESYQLPSFHGRVELKDPEMKNGDASVILKNVNVNDAGTYKCDVRTQSNTKFNQFINLKVTESDVVESGHTAGNPEERGDEEGGDKERGHWDRGNLIPPLVIFICVVGGLVGGFGGLFGGFVGGLVGALVGDLVGSLVGGLVGAVVGGLVGSLLWKHQRSQQQNSDLPAAADEDVEPS